MNCSQASVLMLEADPADIRGQGAVELASHLAACDACRTLAEEILREHDALAKAMASTRARRPVEDAIARARFEATRRKRRRLWIAAVPAAAAAGVAGMLLARPSDTPLAHAASSAPADTVPPPLVESSNADGVTIMHTDNPNIVVVWLTKSRNPS